MLTLVNAKIQASLKTTTDHLPADKQAELQKIVTAIEQRFPAEMIILFGSYARGDWVDDCYKEDGTTYEYKSDYDILVVLDTEVVAIKKESNRRWQNKLRRDTGREAPLNVIFHGIDYLNSEIEDGSYFFMDVLKEGIMLHDSGKFQLATPKPLDRKQRQSKARLYFDKWFDNAEMFYLDFETNFERAKLNEKYLSKAAFELHQATERYYACVLLVYTDYKPKVHDLDKLNGQVGKLDNRFKTIFPRKTEEEERLFTLLKKAYIDSRYKLDYSISRDDLTYLSDRVQKLRELTELACNEKIDSFMVEK